MRAFTPFGCSSLCISSFAFLAVQGTPMQICETALNSVSINVQISQNCTVKVLSGLLMLQKDHKELQKLTFAV